jgi:hypothetical protein
MSAGRLLNLDDEPRSPVLTYAAEGACVLAALAALLSLSGWLLPVFLNAIGDWAMVLGFTITFFGLATAFVCTLTSDLGFGGTPGRLTLRRTPTLADWLSRTPRRLKQVAGVIIAVGIASSVLNFVGTGGYSQNPLGTLPHCEWSIGTNHGFTNLCVSHARWLRTGEQFQRAVLSLIALFLSIESLIFAAVSRRSVQSG